MKLNRSLGISSRIQQLKHSNILGVLQESFPSDLLDNYPTSDNSRLRVFTPNSTLLTMLLTAVQEDKTLQNSVGIYYMLHKQHKQYAQKELEESIQQQKEADLKAGKKAGRPKKYSEILPKSLEKDISLNTAAYSKARDRVPMELARLLFSASQIEDAKNDYTHWHGYRVMVGDGTYIQMQDTESLRKTYGVKYKDELKGYPQGLLEVIIERGTGQIHSFSLSDRHVSELELFNDMIDGLPPQSLLLLDDLYNCYEIIAKSKKHDVNIVMPAKRKRNYEVIETIAHGDEIIKIKVPSKRSRWYTESEIESTLLLRQITCKSPLGTEYILHTTILDKSIDKEEFQALYSSRWDIEISVREVKTIMDINVLRSKTPDMALKELIVSLTAYNLIRKVIYASIKDLPFSPKEDFIQEFYSANKEVLMDKKGRVYNRWSTGRRRVGQTNTSTAATKAKAK